jgi:outer membrane usher protein FimD/PapC
LNDYEKNFLFFSVFCSDLDYNCFAQTKVSGVVVDKQNQPIPFANVVFKGSSEGIVTNEDGKFYLESAKTYVTLLISSVGFSEKK